MLSTMRTKSTLMSPSEALRSRDRPANVRAAPIQTTAWPSREGLVRTFAAPLEGGGASSERSAHWTEPKRMFHGRNSVRQGRSRLKLDYANDGTWNWIPGRAFLSLTYPTA